VRAFYTLCSLVIDNQVRYFSFLRERGYRLPLTFHRSHHQSNVVAFTEDNLPNIDLKAYARRGAEARIAELTAELNDIYKAFPDLGRGAIRPSAARAGAGGRRRKRKPMSAAQRKAVGQRMKAYWAARRKGSK
jgi:hypothetical protein